MIQKVRGTKDYFGDEAKRRSQVFSVIRDVFESYGFVELVTPALEFLDVLKVKGGVGEDNVKDVFVLNDKSGRDLGLRFDLTVPVARFVQENGVGGSVKFYCVGNVWRYERPQKGRLREFWQVGVENLGCKDSVFSDAENVIVVNKILRELGVSNFTFRFSSRELLDFFVKEFSIKDARGFFRVVDKKDKLNSNVWKKELSKFIGKSKDVDVFLKVIKEDYKGLLKFSKNNEKVVSVIKDLKLLEKYCRGGGVSSKSLKFDLSLARGLDYYTGFIFEVTMGKDAIAGGGRYDNLIGLLGKKSLDATGFGIGFDRLMDVVKFNFSKRFRVCLITNDGSNLKELVSLREELVGFVDVFVDFSFSVSKGLGKASKLGVDFCVILGDEELGKGCFVVRDMRKKTQKSFRSVPAFLKLLK